MSNSIITTLYLDPYGNSEIQSYGTMNGMLDDCEALQKNGYTPLFWTNTKLGFDKGFTITESLQILLKEVQFNSRKGQFSDLSAKAFHPDLLKFLGGSKDKLIKCVLGAILHAASINDEFFKLKIQQILCTILEYCHRNTRQVLSNLVIADVFKRASIASNPSVESEIVAIKEDVGSSDLLFLSEVIFEITDKPFLKKLMFIASEAFYGILGADDEPQEKPPIATGFMLL